jgi:hypothetical protein
MAKSIRVREYIRNHSNESEGTSYSTLADVIQEYQHSNSIVAISISPRRVLVVEKHRVLEYSLR